MGIFSNRPEAELSVQSFERCPRELLDNETCDSRIRRARTGECVYASHSGQRANSNLYVNSKRIWMNAPTGGGVA